MSRIGVLVSGRPPALVITVGNDPFWDEGEAYARELKEAGVAATATRYNGMNHDFVLLNAIYVVSGAQAALLQATSAIRRPCNPRLSRKSQATGLEINGLP